MIAPVLNHSQILDQAQLSNKLSRDLHHGIVALQLLIPRYPDRSQALADALSVMLSLFDEEQAKVAVALKQLSGPDKPAN